MARILSIVRCRPEDEGGGTFGSSTPPPRHNQGGTPPWTPLYITLLIYRMLMYSVRVLIKKTARGSPKFRVSQRTGARIKRRRSWSSVRVSN